MATQAVRRLGPTNDVTFGKGRKNYATGSESTEQRLLCFLRGIKGEWFLDTGRFIPWMQPESSDTKPIIAANGARDLGYAEALAKAGILGVDGVKTLQSFEMSFDVTTRGLSMDAKIFDVDGNPILLQQFNPLEFP
jgi:hypothetical protein